MYKMVGFALGMLLAAAAHSAPIEGGGQPAPQGGPAPLPAAEAPKRMTLPDGFSATLFAGEPDVLQPIAFTFDDRGRLWVAECLTYPGWNQDAGPDTKGKDRIIVLDDTDGDGRFDKRTVFKDDLVNLSGIELGFGGVYVCSVPNLLFIPADVNADTPVPTGRAEALLDGWNKKESLHNVFNGLTWGPDGWLYGLNGIQSKSAVGKPGTPDDQRTKFDCGVWRYHPTRGTFEVVTWGTTNPWGLDWDDHGQGFITNCVIKHLWHVIPGAHYERMYGQDYNPNAYELMESCADHIHWGGGDWTSSRGGEGKHGEAGGGHAHVGAMVYLGDNWPDDYRNGLFTLNLHGSRINHDLLERKGSGYVARHGKDFLFANDAWFRGITIKYGPDGGVYFSDWTDTGECHNYKVVDRTNGRIYKAVYRQPQAVRDDLSKASNETLVSLQRHRNEWFAAHARRILQERAVGGGRSSGVAEGLRKLFDEDPSVPHKLRALWALHATGSLDDGQLGQLLSDPEPYVRGWSIQLAAEDRQVQDGMLTKLAELARSDPSPVVRLFLASALQRLPLEQRWGIAEGLASHGEDVADQNLPLMVWYGSEPLVAADRTRVLNLLKGAKIPVVREHIARRAASGGDANRLDPLVRLLDETGDPQVQRDVLRGINAALGGQRRVAMPEGWQAVYRKLNNSPSDEVSDEATALALTFGDPQAFAALRESVGDASVAVATRTESLQALVNARDPQLVPLLHGLLSDSALRGPALRGLAAAGDESTPSLIVGHYPRLTPAEKQDAVQTLASRPAFAKALLDAIESGTVPRTDVPVHIVRQLAGIEDAGVKQRLEKVWGTVRPPAGDKAALIARFKEGLKPEKLKAADLSHGRLVFNRTCAQCHTLFDAGGKVAPDLTGSQRANLDYLLENVLDPNAVVARDYQMTVIDTTDGRTINGIVVAENERSVTVRTTNEDVVVPVGEIGKRRVSKYSMMPEGLLEALKPEEQRDLVGYLASPRQVPAGEEK